MNSAPPTQVRWRILTAIMLMTFLTYVDRLNLSIAGQAVSNSVFHKGHVLRKPATV